MLQSILVIVMVVVSLDKEDYMYVRMEHIRYVSVLEIPLVLAM